MKDGTGETPNQSHMTVEELVAYILKHMTAEEALTKLLGTQIEVFEEQMAEAEAENGRRGSPYFTIIQAAKVLGWDFAIEHQEKEDGIVRGLAVGTPEYLDSLFQHDTP